jgi:transcriptional regulator with XRE-family HTH domain
MPTTILDLDAVSKRMKGYRARLALTQGEVAEILGFPLRTFQSWENGASQTSPGNYELIAAWYSEQLGETITGHELMHGQVPPPSAGKQITRAELRASETRERDQLITYLLQQVDRRLAALRVELLAELAQALSERTERSIPPPNDEGSREEVESA